MLTSPATHLACPACRSALDRSRLSLSCRGCGRTYPVYGNRKAALSWLFAEPESARFDWKARLNGFLTSENAAIDSLAAKIKARPDGATTRRLRRLADAKQHNVARVAAILAPLKLHALSFDQERDPELRALHKLPGHQGVDSYFVNLFRDWSWNNGEYLELRTIVQTLLQRADAEPQVMATLGAGAARLPLDLHLSIRPRISYCLDLNPFLLLAARNIALGTTERLNEIPALPRDDNVAVEQELVASETLSDERAENFHILAANVSDLPLADEGVDTIITPWLIDIVEEPLPGLAARVNRALEPGGVWINSGPLSFLSQEPEHRYSAAEIEEILAVSGFEIVASETQSVGYLCSPFSSNGRVETVFSFAARKVNSIKRPPTFNHLPLWIQDSNQPIPVDSHLAVDAAKHILKAQILSTINGQLSVEKLAKLLAENHGLNQQEARHIVRRILIEHRA